MLKANHYPAIREWQLFSPRKERSLWKKCRQLGPVEFQAGRARIEIDISKYIEQPGQFLLRLDNLGKSKIAVEDIQVFYDGRPVHEEVISTVSEGEMYLLNRHAQIVEDSKIVLKVTLQAKNITDSDMEISIKQAF